MDLPTIVILLAVFIGAWYSLATVIGRRINAKAARSCGPCKAHRYLATGTSYLAEMECEWAKYVGVFVQRLPWDNPFNLAASLLARRKPVAVVKVDLGVRLPWQLDMSSKGALGPAERVGRCYVVGRSYPKALVAELAEACARLGVARIVVGGGPPLQIYIASDNCTSAIQISKTIIEILEKYIKK
ncbi:hypothetical protein TUZN_1269 [Thermoproteus uzoniensis 768-20]|uniref:Uncharacterized protein n=1 Tax=Thermoproteus uzoniensis (strain 768-20) TaxID=999630 RepID=F2L0T0_THEU7|nr:hypothetical protein [Thermoproteus uzoniensis]AEA12745.1 hypothetical protein TUZN_1269 [Thermoproteus uzoniensis 768-20]